MPKGVRIKYSQEELDFLCENRMLTRRELTVLFNEKFNRNLKIRDIARKCLSRGFINGSNGQFKKGNVPYNAGTKGTGLCKANSGSFKKGNLPKSTKKVGDVILKKKENVYKIKIAEPNVWKLRAHYVWEQHNKTPVPENYVVWHINGDSTDDRIENLALRSKLEVLQLNRLQHKSQPDELKETVDLLARVTAKQISLDKKQYSSKT